ncbi:bifunctional metallophosphatase/5'-nucleotidase [Georgenia sp. Z1344]|uniref:bifunctional metallophosphatase/5'-nucleotidase n=1 Tax=Georgenia sp. Z1344 TaxID=3416706 RepID=UPI003CEADCDB
MSRPSRVRITASAGVLALIGSVAAAAPAFAVENEDGTVTIDLAVITDFHGHIETAAQVQTVVDGIRAENETGTLFLSAGDNIGGSAFVSAIANDQPTIDILNAMGLNHTAVGNHEFDQGYEDLRDRVIPASEFSHLGANVAGAPEIADPGFVVEEIDGVSVGIIGTVTSDTPNVVSPAGIEGLEFQDEVDVANERAATLSDGDDANGEADVVVALIHEDADIIAPGLDENIDAAFAGHSHLLKNTETGAGAPLLQPGNFGSHVANTQLTVNPESGEITVDTAENIEITEETARDADIEALYQEALAESQVLGQEEVGTVIAPFNRGSRTGAPDGTNRGAESTLGNLLGDAALASANEFNLNADIGVINPGGIRADLDPNGDGTVTYAEAFDVQPFGNTIGAVTIPGADLRLLLEQQLRTATDSHPYLALGWSENLDYVWDPESNEILSLTIDGEPVADDQEIRIAGNTFLLAGGDAFTGFTDNASNFVDTGVQDVQALNDYLAANEQLAPSYDQASIGWTGPTTAAAGETVSVDLSGLSFTTEPDAKPFEVEVLLGDEVVGTGEVNNDPSDGYNTTGTSTVEITIPEGAEAGEQSLTVNAEPTVAQVPFEVTAGAEEPEPTPPSAGRGFYLNNGWDANAEHEFSFGRVGDDVLVGDWDGDGQDTLGVRRGNAYFLTNSLFGGDADVELTYGRAGDTVLVGDWDGDSVDTFAVRRGNGYFLSNSHESGWAETELDYGRANDQVLVGDYDGDEVDTFAVRRGNTYFVSNTLESGWADAEFDYGRSGDEVLVGDWDGDGNDTFASRRGNLYLMSNALEGGWAEIEQNYGRSGDEVFVGDWDGDGSDTLGVRR